MFDKKTHSALVINYRLRFLCFKFSEESTSIFEKLLDRCEKYLILINKSFLQIAENECFLYILLESIEQVLCAIYSVSNYDSSEKIIVETMIFDRLLPLCFEFGKIVSPVCHNLSPEGFLPSEFFNNGNINY